MRVAIPIAAYEEGTTGEYVARAFRKLGHEATIVSQYQFFTDFRERSYDLYFCVDSGGPLNLVDEGNLTGGDWKRLCFWMIDYRRGKTMKNPNDLDTCRTIANHGGWIFQSQMEDTKDCWGNGIEFVSWLPLAADPQVWSDEPKQAKVYDVGFVGNVWDGVRAQALEAISSSGLRLGFPGHGAAKMESGADVLRKSKVGFNISSFYGDPVAFDVNMRFWETLSVGIPIVTNHVPSLKLIFGDDNLARFVWTYRSFGEIISVLRGAVSDSEFQSYGPDARRWILEFGTYELRISSALDTLRAQKRI